MPEARQKIKENEFVAVISTFERNLEEEKFPFSKSGHFFQQIGARCQERENCLAVAKFQY